MRHAKSPAQQRKKNAASSALIEAEGRLELLRYTAPVGLIPHGLTWLLAEAPHPRAHAAPVVLDVLVHVGSLTGKCYLAIYI